MPATSQQLLRNSTGTASYITSGWLNWKSQKKKSLAKKGGSFCEEIDIWLSFFFGKRKRERDDGTRRLSQKQLEDSVIEDPMGPCEEPISDKKS